MTRYRRSLVRGGSYFFTVVTYRRRKIFIDETMINELRQTIKTVKQNYPFVIDAWVLLPDHMHCIWTLPETDNDYSKRMGLIKAGFTARVRGKLQKPEWMTPSRVRHRESTVWQRRFWEHRIRDEGDFQRHMDYIHFNPVKHGLVKQACDWPYSTFHRYAKQGAYTRDWAGMADNESGVFGE